MTHAGRAADLSEMFVAAGALELIAVFKEASEGNARVPERTLVTHGDSHESFVYGSTCA